MPRRKSDKTTESELPLDGDPERIKRALKTLRTALDVTQKEIAEAMGLKSASSASARETGKTKGRATVDEELRAMGLSREALELADKFVHYIGTQAGSTYAKGAFISPFDFIAESSAAREADPNLAEAIEQARRQGHDSVERYYQVQLGLLLRGRSPLSEMAGEEGARPAR